MNKYDTLNKEQKEAVFHTEGPLLLLAGAGSGKTRVLTHRIAYLIEEKKINPWNIMAITFTNKAAKEMRERVDQLISHGGQDVWVSTFHASCVRILRRNIELMEEGYDRYFTIYDTDDSKRLIRECMKQLQIDPKQFKESAILSEIGSAKNQVLSPVLYKQRAIGDYRKEKVALVYDLYSKKLRKNNALDFGDLLVKTVELFDIRPDILEMYQNKFKYIMVDEYQDTNEVQFRLISMLARKHQNLCVVGDDDQSIYKFRGADIKNILDFESIFSNAKAIKLEQNYRSTKNILEAANEVVKNNRGRKVKRLWTDNEQGDLVVFNQVGNEYEEAQFVTDRIIAGVEEEGTNYKDYAILYRTNMQSRVLEERLIRGNIPYKIFGGVSFYQRKEIKDILAYLRIINNGTDDLAVKRIINVPRRGIGQTTIDKVAAYAEDKDLSFFGALSEAVQQKELSRAKGKILTFVAMIMDFRDQMEQMSLVELLENVLLYTGYKKELELEGTEEAKDRLSNIGELVSKLTEYEKSTDEPTLNGFLEEVALVADVDGYSEDVNYVVLMTLHSAKGLEFPYVFMTGLEDGLFPSYMSISSGDEADIEEERRLCYVGITRAEQKLFISCAKMRMIRGQTQANMVSRFIREIPMNLLKQEGLEEAPSGLYQRRSNSSPSKGSRPTKQWKNPYLNSNPYINKGMPSQKPITNKKNDVNLFATEKKTIPTPKTMKLDYGVGDLVKHPRFGLGMVEKIEGGGADHQVTVNFPSSGVKKLMASLAGLKKN